MLRLFRTKSKPTENKAVGDQEEMTPEMLARALLAGGDTEAGYSVNWKTAVTVEAVLACSRVIANGLAQVPLKLYRPKVGGGVEVVTKGVGKLLSRKASSIHTAFRLRHSMGMQLALKGSFSAYKNIVAGDIVELLPYQIGDVTVAGDIWNPIYSAFNARTNKMEELPRDRLLHIVGLSLDGASALDTINLARQGISLAIATTNHAARTFRNGAASSGIYTTDEKLDKQQRAQLISALDEIESSSGGAYKKNVLWGGLKYQHTSYANDQAQLQQLRDQQVERVCMAFGVNPIMVGYTGGKTPTYASAEQLFTAHTVHTLGPLYKCVEEELDAQLLTEDEIDAGYYWKHSVQGLMRGSHEVRAKYYKDMWSIGSLNPNEIRDFEELNPYNRGNEFRVPLNTEAAGEEGKEDA